MTVPRRATARLNKIYCPGEFLLLEKAKRIIRNHNAKTAKSIYHCDEARLEQWALRSGWWARFERFWHDIKDKHVEQLSKNQQRWLETKLDELTDESNAPTKVKRWTKEEIEAKYGKQHSI